MDHTEVLSMVIGAKKEKKEIYQLLCLKQCRTQRGNGPGAVVKCGVPRRSVASQMKIY